MGIACLSKRSHLASDRDGFCPQKPGSKCEIFNAVPNQLQKGRATQAFQGKRVETRRNEVSDWIAKGCEVNGTEIRKVQKWN